MTARSFKIEPIDSMSWTVGWGKYEMIWSWISRGMEPRLIEEEAIASDALFGDGEKANRENQTASRAYIVGK